MKIGDMVRVNCPDSECHNLTGTIVDDEQHLNSFYTKSKFVFGVKTDAEIYDTFLGKIIDAWYFSPRKLRMESEMKIGDRVKVNAPTSLTYGATGVIVDRSPYGLPSWFKIELDVAVDGWILTYRPESELVLLESEPKQAAPQVCKCNVMAGCTCGVFQREMEAKRAREMVGDVVLSPVTNDEEILSAHRNMIKLAREVGYLPTARDVSHNKWSEFPNDLTIPCNPAPIGAGYKSQKISDTPEEESLKAKLKELHTKYCLIRLIPKEVETKECSACAAGREMFHSQYWVCPSCHDVKIMDSIRNIPDRQTEIGREKSKAAREAYLAINEPITPTDEAFIKKIT